MSTKTSKHDKISKEAASITARQPLIRVLKPKPATKMHVISETLHRKSKKIKIF